jgi:hypothetical protein
MVVGRGRGGEGVKRGSGVVVGVGREIVRGIEIGTEIVTVMGVGMRIGGGGGEMMTEGKVVGDAGTTMTGARVVAGGETTTRGARIVAGGETTMTGARVVAGGETTTTTEARVVAADEKTNEARAVGTQRTGGRVGGNGTALMTMTATTTRTGNGGDGGRSHTTEGWRGHRLGDEVMVTAHDL